MATTPKLTNDSGRNAGLEDLFSKARGRMRGPLFRIASEIMIPGMEVTEVVGHLQSLQLGDVNLDGTPKCQLSIARAIGERCGFTVPATLWTPQPKPGGDGSAMPVSAKVKPAAPVRLSAEEAGRLIAERKGDMTVANLTREILAKGLIASNGFSGLSISLYALINTTRKRNGCLFCSLPVARAAFAFFEIPEERIPEEYLRKADSYAARRASNTHATKAKAGGARAAVKKPVSPDVEVPGEQSETPLLSIPELFAQFGHRFEEALSRISAPQPQATPAPVIENRRVAEFQLLLNEANTTIGKLKSELEVSETHTTELNKEVTGLRRDVKNDMATIAGLKQQLQVQERSGKTQPEGPVDLTEMASKLCELMRLHKEVFRVIGDPVQRDVACRRVEEVVKALTAIVDLIVVCKQKTER